MTGLGLLEYIRQATHVAKGFGIPFNDALALVNEAQAAIAHDEALREQAYLDADREMHEAEPIIVVGNLISGVPFGKPRERERGGSL
jgi:hypothetical protein